MIFDNHDTIIQPSIPNFSFEYPTNQKMIPITSQKNDFNEEFAKFGLYIISYYTLTSSLCNNV